MVKLISVSNLPFNSTQVEIRGLFKNHGTVKSIDMIDDLETGRFRGFCFVELADADDVLPAIEALDGLVWKGRALMVNEARPREERNGGDFSASVLQSSLQERIQLQLDVEIAKFTKREQTLLVSSLAQVLGESVPNIQILEIKLGSPYVLLEMPKQSVHRLVDMILNRAPIVKELRIIGFELRLLEQKSAQQKNLSGFSNSNKELSRLSAPDLRRLINKDFNDSELRDLCHDMKIDYEALPGQGKNDKVRELVIYVERHNRMGELEQNYRRLRPNTVF